ncbi:hypothetical protein [uncultured Faecalibaculum sp.]|nr:hypothetical protein [uncultured Faecalibaculum sp.]
MIEGYRRKPRELNEMLRFALTGKMEYKNAKKEQKSGCILLWLWYYK